MHQSDLFFVIPTYRLREVGETVEEYDDHFLEKRPLGPNDCF